MWKPTSQDILKVVDKVWREKWVKQKMMHYWFSWVGQSDTSKAKTKSPDLMGKNE